jgi:hypothetical protein
MYLLLAPDAPIQPDVYQNKLSFSMAAFQSTFDRLSGQIQRLAYWTQRALTLDDGDDSQAINARIPPGMASNPGATLCVNPGGTGWSWGATLSQIAAALGYASTAQAAQTAADVSASQAGASAALAQSALSAIGAGLYPSGTNAAPLAITAVGGISLYAVQWEVQFIKGSGGPVVVTATPEIAESFVTSPGLLVGKILTR